MPTPFRQRLAARLLVAGLVALTCLAPAAPGQAQPAAQELTPATPASNLETDLRARLAAIRTDETLGEAEREQRAAVVESALAELASSAEAEARAAAFIASIESAADEARDLRATLDGAATDVPPPAERPSDDLEVLQQQATTLDAEVAGQRSRVEDLEGRLAEERARVKAAPLELAGARVRFEELRVALDAAEPIVEPNSLRALERLREIAAQQALAAEIAALEQEILSQPVRVELLEAEVDAARARLDELAAAAARAQQWVSDVRRARAAEASAEAARASRAAIGKHQQIVELAAANATFAEAAKELAPRIDAVRAQRTTVESSLAVAERDFREISESLRLGVTRSLGDVLVELRRELPDSRPLLAQAGDLRDEAMEQRLELFVLERELRRLDDLEAVLQQRLERPSATALDEAERADLRAEFTRLLEARRVLVEVLAATRSELLAVLVEVEARKRKLGSVLADLAALLDERLLWIPNMSPIVGGGLTELSADLLWLAGSGLWIQAARDLARDVASQAALYAVAALVVIVLVARRRRSRATLHAIAADVGKVRKDGILLTIRALFLHLVIALPQPLAIAFVGWRLEQAEGAADTTRAIGHALLAASAAALALALARGIMRADGLGRVHFDWSDRAGKLIRRHLVWFTPIAVVATFLIELAREQREFDAHTALGAFGLTVLGLSSAVFVGAVFGRKLGLAASSTSSLVRWTRSLWLPLGVLVPTGLAAMAAAGYQYAAQRLAYRLEDTILIVVAAILVHAFLLRWLTVSQRRLALKVAIDKRNALIERRAAGELDSEVEGILEPIDEIDVAEIRSQTQDLLRIAVGFLVIVGLWLTWADTLPALSILREQTLWDHVVTVEGVPTTVPITVANVALALLFVAITVAAARNAPGFLEIAVLQRLPLDPGARYATRTLTLYAIVATGLVLAFNAIGVDWSSVQWLVAALTVGLGFGLQEIFANFVSGLIILLERPVRVGDTVTVSNTTGVVTRIRMRATTITDWQRRELVVPNRNFITGELINWSLSDPILRLDFVVGIAYGSDTTLAQKVMLDVVRAHPMVLDQPESNVFFVGFGDSTLNFEVRVFVSEPTNVGRTRIKHDLHMAIDQACRANQVEIAFPQRDLHVRPSDGVLRVSLEGPGTAKSAAEPSVPPGAATGGGDGAPDAEAPDPR